MYKKGHTNVHHEGHVCPSGLPEVPCALQSSPSGIQGHKCSAAAGAARTSAGVVVGADARDTSEASFSRLGILYTLHNSTRSWANRFNVSPPDFRRSTHKQHYLQRLASGRSSSMKVHFGSPFRIPKRHSINQCYASCPNDSLLKAARAFEGVSRDRKLPACTTSPSPVTEIHSREKQYKAHLPAVKSPAAGWVLVATLPAALPHIRVWLSQQGIVNNELTNVAGPWRGGIDGDR
ncbi:unnamed protein product [Notodromas monacha]|uniref:Uncharacterized protein n=1 Tax=Notodromas monacha TaxID=399045 RepID=A0A7R9G8D5_9CRUS|nr:unnamed protein product [Notodromas monacha]CAG0913164.1 unnamed protein product [Notodromas monacha]